MKNTPLTSIKVSDGTFRKLHLAAKKSGKGVAEVRRICLDLGLDVFERVGYNLEKFASDHIAISVIPPLSALPDPKIEQAK